MNEKKANLILSCISLTMGLLVFILVSYAWYIQNVQADVNSLTILSQDRNLTAEIRFYEARKEGDRITYAKDGKEPTTMPIYDSLLAATANNAIVVELSLQAQQGPTDALFEIQCSHREYSTTYPDASHNNYVSNIISFANLGSPTETSDTVTHTIAGTEDSFVELEEDGLTPKQEKKQVLQYELTATTDATRYYYVIFYHEISLNYFYSNNLDHVDLSENGELVFRQDVTFNVKEVA